MTNISIYKANDTYKGIRVEGHSGYAEAGYDIVCAGISVLVINFINSVDAFTEDKFILNEDEDKGLIEFKFENKPSDDARLLFKSLIMGLEDLEKENKDFISLDYKEV